MYSFLFTMSPIAHRNINYDTDVDIKRETRKRIWV